MSAQFPEKTKHRGTWVQTERKAHEAWAQLTGKKPRAAQLLHVLIAHMQTLNAIVVSQTTLAKMLNCSVRTIQYAIKDLEAGNWIQTIRIGKGKEAAYVINSRVAWADSREKLRYSRFEAIVIADYEDQNLTMIDKTTGELRQIPALYPDEIQLPTGEGEPPPQQRFLHGLEPEMPYLKKSEN